MKPKPNKNLVFPQNYSLISLLLILSKVVERVVAAKHDEETETLGALPSKQFGLRNGHPTEQQILGLIEIAVARLNQRQMTGTYY